MRTGYNPISIGFEPYRNINFRPDLLNSFASLFPEESDQEISTIWDYAKKMSGSKVIQGFKGIRQWPINLCTSPMMLHKINPSIDYYQ